jgi:hypothetical protein
MSRSMPSPTVHALDVARALAGTGDPSVLEALLTVLGPGNSESVRTWKMLVHGGLAPLTAHVFTRRGWPERAEPRLREALQSAHDVNAVRNGLLRRAALDASRALSAAALTPLWAKGIWLAHTVYAQPALRTMSDIDLIVPEGSRADACRVLLDLGYVRDPAVPPEGAACWTDTLSRPATLPGGEPHVQIDLHDRIHLSATRVWPVGRLWERAARTRMSGVDVWLPTREAGLLYLAVHLFKHGFDLRHALVAVTDAAFLLRAHDGRLDREWLEQQLDDPRDATALYMLLAQLGTQPTPAAQALYDRLGQQLDARGLRTHADTLLASAERLTLSAASDFSLFEVGEQASVARAVSGVFAGARRWRRRVHAPAAPTPVKASWAAALQRANWRFAYTTFLAGRLNARLDTERR